MNTRPTAADSQWGQWLHRGTLKLRHLKVVLAIAQSRSIGLAASALHVSQPAITKALKEVEAAAGTALFERRANGTFPTAAGLAVVRYATEVFGTLERAGDELEVLSSGFSGSLSIGCNFPSAVRLLPEAILKLSSKNPRVSITVHEAPLEVLLPELRMRRLDVLVARWPSEAQALDLVEHARFSQPMSVVAAADHPLVRQGRVSWGELAEWSWLMPPKGSAVRRELDELLRSKGLKPQVLPIESSSPTANAVMLRRLSAVTVVPSALLNADNEFHGLVRVGVTIPPRAFSPSSVITLKDRDTRPEELALFDCLKAVSVEMARSAV